MLRTCALGGSGEHAHARVTEELFREYVPSQGSGTSSSSVETA